MATDKSEPRVGLILQVGALAVVTLVIVHAALTTYFDRVAQAEELRKYGDLKPEALLNMRDDEKARLASGPLPIEKAMQQIVTKGRRASVEITPAVSKDLAPLQGWARMPAQVPSEMTAEAPAGSEAPGDAGATATAIDAGPSKTKADHARGDGGAGPGRGSPKSKP
jgi:hypothetical protein